jgi:hypothetical protein
VGRRVQIVDRRRSRRSSGCIHPRMREDDEEMDVGVTVEGAEADTDGGREEVDGSRRWSRGKRQCPRYRRTGRLGSARVDDSARGSLEGG